MLSGDSSDGSRPGTPEKPDFLRQTPREYWQTRLKEHWNLHGVGYMGYGLAYNRWLYRVREKVFLRHVRALPLDFPRLRILDVGSGTGFYVALWKSLGVESVIASDIAPVAIEQLRQAFPEVTVVELDIGSPLAAHNFRDAFDVVTAFDVLFHVIDDNRFHTAVRNVSALCKPGGYFIFSDNFLHGKTLKTRYQVNRSLEEITHVVETAGFRIVKRAPVFFVMNAPVDTKGWWPLLLWRFLLLPVRALHFLGALYGAALFPLEIMLTLVLKESPTTEILICQKRS